MIYEIRTYSLVPGSLAEVEKRFGEAYEYRKKYSEMAAFWHTDVGPLNEIIHVWPYQDLAERTRIRAQATANETNWPPKIGEFIRTQQSEILIPFPFSPLLRPGKLGPIYEMRIYTIKPGTLPEIRKAWEAKLPERIKLSPLAVAGSVELGEVNRFIHIWPYTSFEQRAAIRAQAVQLGIWPPRTSELLLTQANKIMVPAAFSPLQ
ncbi:MAG: NIPSNAP family protein [Chloroflexota bacterium]